jgi:hypothetical protein
MTYADGQSREMAKWAHHRLDADRRREEEEQRQALADLNVSVTCPLGRSELGRSSTVDEQKG